MGTIAKVTAGGATHLIASSAYGTCSTAAATVAKVATIQDSQAFTLIAGTTVHIYFTYSNTAASPTLNVNSTGALPIYKYGTTVPGKTAATSWAAGAVVSFTYNTTARSAGCWTMNDHIDDTDSNTNTWRGVNVNGTALLGTGTSTGSVNFKSGTNTTVSGSGNDITINATNTTYGVVSKTANGLAPQLPNETTTTKYLRQDGSWQVPPDTNTDTKVTAVGNHYTPAEDTTAALSADASSTTAATWNSTSLVTGVNIKRDAKGHVVGIGVDSIKMPANPNTNTDTLVTQTNTTGNADYRVLFSENANDTTETKTARKNTSFKYNPSTGNLTVTKLNGVAIGTSPKFTDTDTKVTTVGNHYTPAEDTTAALSADASSTTAATWNSTSLVTGVNIKRDAKGHVVGITVDSIKMPANPNSNNAVTQTATDTADANYRVLFSATADDTTRTEGARKDKDLTYNPSTGQLTIASQISVAGIVLKPVTVSTW